jgi:hypothetical protein
VPDVLESVFEYPQNFLAQMCVNLKNSAPQPGMVVYGSEGTLVWDADKIVVTGEPEDKDIQLYGNYAWPKAMRDQYYRSKGADPANPRASGSARPAPKQFKVAPGPSHTDLFLESIRRNKPSPEPAIEGHAAAGAAHLANRAYRDGRKLNWNFETNQVT